MRSTTLVLWLLVGLTGVLASPVPEPAYDGLNSLSDLFGILYRAAEIGKEELQKVLADPRVDALINRLTGFSKKTALSIVQYFKGLLTKSSSPIEYNALIQEKEDSDESSFQQLSNDASLVDKIYQLIGKARRLGLEALRNVLNSSELIRLVDSILSPELSKYVKKHIAALKQSVEELLEDEKSQLPVAVAETASSDVEILRELFHTLTVAAKGGKDALLRVLNDPEIRKYVNNLGMFAKKMALDMLNYFESKLQPSSAPLAGDSTEEPMKVLENLFRLLDRARKEGMTALKNFLESQELKDMTKSLPQGVLLIARTYINMFSQILKDMLEQDQLLTMVAVAESSEGNSESDEAISDLLIQASAEETLNPEEKITAAQIMRQIIRYIHQTTVEGKEKLAEVLESEYIRYLVNKLPRFTQRAVNWWLNSLKKIVNLNKEDIKNFLDNLKSKLD